LDIRVGGREHGPALLSGGLAGGELGGLPLLEIGQARVHRIGLRAQLAERRDLFRDAADALAPGAVQVVVVDDHPPERGRGVLAQEQLYGLRAARHVARPELLGQRGALPLEPRLGSGRLGRELPAALLGARALRPDALELCRGARERLLDFPQRTRFALALCVPAREALLERRDLLLHRLERPLLVTLRGRGQRNREQRA